MSMRRVLPRLAVALLIVTAGAWAAVHRDEINLATLDASFDSLGLWAPIGYMILYAFAAVAFIPKRAIDGVDAEGWRFVAFVRLE